MALLRTAINFDSVAFKNEGWRQMWTESASQPQSVIGLGDAPPGWPWFYGMVGDRFVYVHFAALPSPSAGRLAIARQRASAALGAAFTSRRRGVHVSFGPSNALYLQAALLAARARSPHLCWSFNFTEIPQGLKGQIFKSLLNKIDAFVVHSNFERDLYATRFGLDVKRLHFVRWGANRPDLAEPVEPLAQPYYVALGGEGRDYATLTRAAWATPEVAGIFIGRPASFAGLAPPPWVMLYENLPPDRAWRFVKDAAFAVLPLKTAETANGHVTIVGTMHLGKAQIVTRSAGILDYLDEERAIFVDAGNSDCMAQAITELMGRVDRRQIMGTNARDYAARHCTEAHVKQSADALIERLSLHTAP